MPRKQSGVKAAQPKNIFLKPLKFEFKSLFKALANGTIHVATVKWEELAKDSVEALAAIGLATDPQELAFLLIRRAAIRAIFDLGRGSAGLLEGEKAPEIEHLTSQLGGFLSIDEFYIDRKFLERPADLPLITELQKLFRFWLIGFGVSDVAADTVARRLPSYFVFALNDEWHQNSKQYQPLKEALDTPFAKATERESAWLAYEALLKRRTEESVFDEPFSLAQIFVPLNAYFFGKSARETGLDEMTRDERRPRIVVRLHEELVAWAEGDDQQDTLRVISGGPGSGKSSFARIFASYLATKNKRVLFIPLHQIDAAADLVTEVAGFVKAEGVLPYNPLDPDSPEPNLIMIFDGLDELASQGKAAAQTARDFVNAVDRLLSQRNHQTIKVRVLISGREVVVQDNESALRRERQILFLLPYFVSEEERKAYRDTQEVLKIDSRGQWWRTFGELTGEKYKGLPGEVDRYDLTEITSQPLLNFLLALSFGRGKINVSDSVTLNVIYRDLLDAVYARGYEKKRPWAPLRHISLDNFSRILEEIALAAWHGGGRTTTVREIEEHCCASGLDGLLAEFQEGAKAGVTRLLAAFFFRKYGARASGDPTFEFTHKSFGEYLTSLRIFRGIQRIHRERIRQVENPGEGWDNKQALKHWVDLCGPTAFSSYLLKFLRNEIALVESSRIRDWQQTFTELFNFMLKHGVPMEQTDVKPFLQMMFQSRNAEEALLAALNACALVTSKISSIGAQGGTTFGAWFKRIQGQRSGPDSLLATDCLSFLDLSSSIMPLADLFSANLLGANLAEAELQLVTLRFALLRGANLEEAKLLEADMRGADLEGASLAGANLEGANLQKAKLLVADMRGVVLNGAKLLGACRR